MNKSLTILLFQNYHYLDLFLYCSLAHCSALAKSIISTSEARSQCVSDTVDAEVPEEAEEASRRCYRFGPDSLTVTSAVS